MMYRDPRSLYSGLVILTQHRPFITTKMASEIGPSSLEVNDTIANEINKQLQEESSQEIGQVLQAK